MGKVSKYVYFAISFLFLTLVNLFLSNLIVYKLTHGLELSNALFRLTYAQNTGAAFSLLENSTIFLVILSIIGICLIFYFVIRNINSIRAKEILLISFLLAGILGNLSERLVYGYVRDYFDLTFVNFPIFNISDIFINISVIGIIILILFAKKSFRL